MKASINVAVLNDDPAAWALQFHILPGIPLGDSIHPARVWLALAVLVVHAHVLHNAHHAWLSPDPTRVRNWLVMAVFRMKVPSSSSSQL
jgi:hypothetical protein